MNDTQITDFIAGPAQALSKGKLATLLRAREAQVQAWQAFPSASGLHAATLAAVIEAIATCQNEIYKSDLKKGKVSL